MQLRKDSDLAEVEHEDPTRRDFIVVAAGAFAAVGGAIALWPLLDQMNPDASTLSQASIDVDVASVQPGQAITVMWRGKPVFIRNRSPEEVEQAKAVPINQLPDKDSRNENKPGAEATDANRTLDGHEQWLVVVGICTHLGCVPKGNAIGDVKGDFGGWFCPCHGSLYDTAGRVRRGPAPTNLEIPKYAFESDTKIKIG